MTDPYGYFRGSRVLRIPRTPASALHGVEDGVLPPEAYIYRATSVKPLFEAPVELMEIDRLLAYPSIDIETVLLISSILARLLKDPDKETALFAAESIGAIEKRYTARIESAKKRYRRTKDPLLCRRLARLCFNLARINGREAAIKKFYLRESFSWLKKLSSARPPSKKEIILKIRVLLELGLHRQAAAVFVKLKKGLNDPDIRYLRAAAEYYEKNYTEVLARCEAMEDTGYASLYRFWNGTSPPETRDREQPGGDPEA